MELQAILHEGFSKARKDRIVKYVGKDRSRFDELMGLFLSGNDRTAQVAGWALSYCAEAYPELLQPYYKKLVDKFLIPNLPDAVLRNMVRMFQFVDLPETLHGKVMDKCFQLIAEPHVAVAIKAFSLTVLENLSQIYPEIKGELKLIIQERAPHETAAFSSRAKKIITRMEKLNAK